MNGYKQVMEARGRLGVAVQHEMDHLEGKTIRKAISSFEMTKALKQIKATLRERKREFKKMGKS
jgi:peptide deformylase